MKGSAKSISVYPKRTGVKRVKRINDAVPYKEEKVKMIVRFARWILNKYDNYDQHIGSISISDRILDRHTNTVQFSVHPASGGYVVESSFYNEREDRHERNLHIITSQEDFSKELAQAVFMDMLKR